MGHVGMESKITEKYGFFIYYRAKKLGTAYIKKTLFYKRQDIQMAYYQMIAKFPNKQPSSAYESSLQAKASPYLRPKQCHKWGAQTVPLIRRHTDTVSTLQLFLWHSMTNEQTDYFMVFNSHRP